ncbi:PREDICTED: V-type proton ATPase subunit S1-like [Poecilia mexicana]|uniref:ATPase H+ transporting accessory protein 1b n=1 Tax=Poecilia mexicana TaxID=48701 RepID=A0A3B3WHZ4_9TELE|nr:PREDICTED: V-type proton ATPase subunit S1-like [Poecilia mexicana]
MAESRNFSNGSIMAFIFFFAAFLASGSSTAQVPFLMWSTKSLPSLTSPPAGHITSMEELAAYLTPVFGSGSNTVLLFLQDKLSKDDFTLFGGVFGNKQESAFRNLEAALQSSSSSVSFPALEWTGESAIPTLLQQKLGASPLLVDPDTLSHLSLNTSTSNLLIINLPYCSDSLKSCKEVLSNNDEIIGKVLSSLKAKDVSYTAAYTGLQPSQAISKSSLLNQQVGRTLLQAPAADVKAPIIFSNTTGFPCIMLWAQNLSISPPGSTDFIDLAQENATVIGSMCNSTNSELVLTYVNYILRFAMSQRFYPVSARNWFTLDSVQVQVRSSGQTASFVGSHGIYAPAEYSFHCQSVSSFRDTLLVPANQNATQWKLNFVDFQIQGFSLANGTNFSYASDCASFFTAGIWMGLVTSLLMLLIFVYGLHMIMQLNTMDRFDDPKGPTISVPQSD